MSFLPEAEAVAKDAEAVAKDAETVAPEVIHAVGDIVHVVESDGSKVPAIIVALEKDAHDELVAFVHRLTHDGVAIATKQTAAPPVRDEAGNVVAPGDKPVAVIAPIPKAVS